MQSTLRDPTYTFLSKFATIFFTIGTQSCLAWVLCPEKRGSYAVCIMFSTLLSLLFMVGSDTASIYFVSSRKFSLSEGVLYTLIYVGLGSVLAILVGIFLINLNLKFTSKAPLSSLYLVLLTIPTSVFMFVFTRLFTAIQDFKWFAIFTGLGYLLQLVFTLLFVLTFKLGINGAIISLFLNGLITSSSILIFLNHKYKFHRVAISFSKLRDMLSYGLRYYVGKISNTVNYQIGTIILAFIANVPEIGMFAVGFQLVTKAMLFPDTLGTVLMPKSSSLMDGGKDLVAYSARVTLVVCGVALLLLAILAKPVIYILFSEKFALAVPLLQILCLGVFVRSVCKIFTPYLLGTNHPEIASISVLIGTLINLGLLWYLYPIIGIKGAAVGMVVSYLVSSTILLLGFLKYSQKSLTDVFSFRKQDWVYIYEKFSRRLVRTK